MQEIFFTYSRHKLCTYNKATNEVVASGQNTYYDKKKTYFHSKRRLQVFSMRGSRKLIMYQQMLWKAYTQLGA